MFYVYLLRSKANAKETYIGFTADIRQRFEDHNAGKSPHTSKFRPWNLVNYIAFTDKARAQRFEKYLKSGSGRAFANRHLW